MKAWHFCNTERTLGYGDGRKIEVGKSLTHEGDLELCYSGLHASVDILDALRYAPGPIACRVKLAGEILEVSDKVVATERKVLWMVDATEALGAFARGEALRVAHLWDAPEVVLKYLRTGDESLREAALAASYAAASHASHASYAASHASYAAARTAPYAYAAAANDASYACNAAEQSKRLETVVREARK